METWKKYLPYIIGGIILLYFLSKFSNRQTSLAPQTQISQIPQLDPFATLRGEAFKVLADTANTQQSNDIALKLGLRAQDVELATANLLANVQIQSNNLQFLNSNYNRQTQQDAIDRYYSSRNLQTISGSAAQTLQRIFGPRSGNVFGTPPTFPTGGFY